MGAMSCFSATRVWGAEEDRRSLLTPVFILGGYNSRGLRYRRTARILLDNEENAQSKGQLVSFAVDSPSAMTILKHSCASNIVKYVFSFCVTKGNRAATDSSARAS
jgi:hypothetical protein